VGGGLRLRTRQRKLVRLPTLTKLQLMRTGAFVSRWQRLFRKVIKFPKSTFGRIALMLAALLLINQLTIYLWVTFFIVKPQNDQIMLLIAPEVILINQQINDYSHFQSISETLELQFSGSGIRLIDTTKFTPKALTDASLNKDFSRSLSKHIQLPTQVKIEISDAEYAWIKMPNQSQYWLRYPLATIDQSFPAPQLIFAFLIMVLSLLGGWWVARSISRPLKRLEFAAREVGRGDRPGNLKMEGTREMRSVTHSFNQMAHDVQQFEEDRTILLAGISHDLRTPLTRIRLAMEFLSDKEAELRDDVIRDTEDMDEIIAQFIGFVRDGRDESLEIADINELIRIVADPIDVAPLKVTLELAELPEYTFKPLAMKRLLTNLVENAKRYGGDEILITSQFEKNNIIVSVLDNGPGIDESLIKELFQPFKRGESARTSTGSGLGLSIVEKITALHEGTINLINRPEGGLEARLIVPIEREFD